MIRKTLTVLSLIGLLGCQADQKKLATTGWPPQIAGRSLRGITDDYALYANDAGSAEELRRWLDIALENFRSDESDDCTKPGVVLAIEPDEDPLLMVEQWRKENVNRDRRITWTSPIRNQTFSSTDGRPYCLFSGNYFRESFSMSFQEAIRVGILDVQDPRPAWICFFATDQHLMVAFNKQREQMDQRQSERVKDVPVMVRVLSFPSELIFSAAALVVIPKYRSIDIELMHLQRRETLNRALIKACYEDGLLRTERLKNIRDETDRAWKDIWVRRPIE